jgi:hypothetical protein
VALDPKTMFTGGQPVAAEPEPPTVELPAETRAAFDRDSYAWAADVFFVYDRQTATAKQAKSWTPARQGLLKMLKSDPMAYMAQLVPKAMALYEKAKDKNGDADAVILEEKKDINKLKQILAAAIVEAQGPAK